MRQTSGPVVWAKSRLYSLPIDEMQPIAGCLATPPNCSTPATMSSLRVPALTLKSAK
jgi:hypothetical protein